MPMKRCISTALWNPWLEIAVAVIPSYCPATIARASAKLLWEAPALLLAAGTTLWHTGQRKVAPYLLCLHPSSQHFRDFYSHTWPLSPVNPTPLIISSVLQGIRFPPVASATSCGNAEGIHLCAEWKNEVSLFCFNFSVDNLVCSCTVTILSLHLCWDTPFYNSAVSPSVHHIVYRDIE